MKLTKAQSEEVLAIVKSRKGKARPEDVYEASKSPNSSLYKLVGWDKGDDELARRYRLDQARLVLCCLKLWEDVDAHKAASRATTAAERERLSGMLEEMKESGARRLINYAEDRRHGKEPGGADYIDVAAEYARGRDRKVARELLRELRDWVGSRGLMHPGLHAHMLAALEGARALFDPPEEAAA